MVFDDPLPNTFFLAWKSGLKGIFSATKEWTRNDEEGNSLLTITSF